jgi:homoserine dehydrogenase
LKPVKVGLVGLGTVGSSVFNLLISNRTELERRLGRTIDVVHVGARRDNPACNLSAVRVSRNVLDVVIDPDVDIVVELIGGTTVAKEIILTAIAQGKHVVTANKALIAQHGQEIFAAATEKGVGVYFEAAVAGGIPVIKALREGLSGNRIEWLVGIINGTGNFILSKMRNEGAVFAEILKQAQALGYAEADPTFDVEGIDAAHKLAILASVAYGIPLQFDKIFTEGISQIEIDDINYAQQFGYRIKHLGVSRRTAQGIELRVHPTLIPERCPIANIDGIMNGVLIHANAVGPTLYSGAGAGGNATASAVIADLVDVARSLDVSAANRMPPLGFQSSAMSDVPVLAMDEVETAYYLRMTAEDHPGVLADITRILSSRGISIEALLQKEVSDPAHDLVPIVLLTQRIKEKEMNAAIAEIEALDSIASKVVRIRLERLDA